MVDSTIRSTGLGSGIDIEKLVGSLLEIEKRPLLQLDRKEGDYQAKLSAYGTLKSAAEEFHTAVADMTAASKYSTIKASVSDSSLLTVTSASIAKAGSHSISVSQLAQNHKLASQGFADTTTVVGSGKLTIDFGAWDDANDAFTVNGDKTAKTITIDSSNNSLAGIRDAINNADAGVTASIINDGDSWRILLASDDSGAANSIRISVDDDDGDDGDNAGLSRLAWDPAAAAGAGKNLEQTIAARDARLSIDGLAITRSSNKIGDAITGVTLNLLKTSGADEAPAQLKLNRDTSGPKDLVNKFVDTFNEMAKTVKELGGYDFKTQEGGLLLGDATLRSIQSQLRSIVSRRLDHIGGVTSLSAVGIAFQRDGTLKINDAKLDKVLADPSKDITPLFAVKGVASDSSIGYVSSKDETRDGRYDVFISRAATRGIAVATSTLAASTTIDANNDTLKIDLNGVAATITLNHGDYSRDQLTAELEARINSVDSFVKKGAKVSVSHDNGKLTIRSELYGAKSSVSIRDSTAASALFGSSNAQAGVDVAGSIGGRPASGDGQKLTGAGDASGLVLLIEGGVGPRGEVSFTRGIAWQLDQSLKRITDKGGALDARTNGIDKSIEDIESQREKINDRLEDVEERLRKQFNAMDRIVSQWKNLSDRLQTQFDALNNSKK